MGSNPDANRGKNLTIITLQILLQPRRRPTGEARLLIESQGGAVGGVGGKDDARAPPLSRPGLKGGEQSGRYPAPPAIFFDKELIDPEVASPALQADAAVGEGEADVLSSPLGESKHALSASVERYLEC